VEADVSSSAESEVLEATSECVQVGQSRASFIGVKVGAPPDRRVTQGKSEAGTYNTVGLGK
jgi:dolichol kinase